MHTELWIGVYGFRSSDDHVNRILHLFQNDMSQTGSYCFPFPLSIHTSIWLLCLNLANTSSSGQGNKLELESRNVLRKCSFWFETWLSFDISPNLCAFTWLFNQTRVHTLAKEYIYLRQPTLFTRKDKHRVNHPYVHTDR